MEFKKGLSPMFEENLTIQLINKGEFIGLIDYMELNNDIVELTDLRVFDSENRRKGYGTSLIKKFVSVVGEDKQIRAMNIIHDETIQELFELGLFKIAISQNVNLTDIDTISKLPIVRVLQSGGININNIQIIFEDKTIDSDEITPKSYEEILKIIERSNESFTSYFSVTIEGTT